MCLYSLGRNVMSIVTKGDSRVLFLESVMCFILTMETSNVYRTFCIGFINGFITFLLFNLEEIKIGDKKMIVARV